MSERIFRPALIGLVCLRLAMMVLLVSGIPHLIVKDGWYFHHGGDQGMMFDAAKSVLAGKPVYTYVGAGMPLVMAGLSWLFHADSYLHIVVPMVLINGFLLGSLSIVVMARLARRLTGRFDLALLAAAVWTLLPYLFYALFGLHPDAALFRDSYVPFLFWANGLSEGPSLFLYLLGVALVLKGLDERRAWPVAAAGLALGFACVVRIHTAVPVAVLTGLLLLKREWRALTLLVGGMIVGFLPQSWYSHGYSGSAINIPYIQNWLRLDERGHLWLDLKNTPFAPKFLIENTLGIAQRHLGLATAGLMLGAAGLFGLARFWRERGWFKALLLFASPVATWLFHAVTYVFASDPFRFTVPAFPLGTIAGVYTFFAARDLWLARRAAGALRAAAPGPASAGIRSAPERGS